MDSQGHDETISPLLRTNWKSKLFAIFRAPFDYPYLSRSYSVYIIIIKLNDGWSAWCNENYDLNWNDIIKLHILNANTIAWIEAGSDKLSTHDCWNEIIAAYT